jgi:23S rRNA pseudouridine1911/1915/1917 synthase
MGDSFHMMNSIIETVKLPIGNTGGRLDRVLVAHIPGLSRSRLKALILSGQVTIGARVVHDPATRVSGGITITISLPPPEPASPQGEAIPLNIVYEDDALIVIEKPRGLVVHPAAGHATGTLVNALIAHCGNSLSGVGGIKRPGIVHRLDKDTSGLMVIAKTDYAHQLLSKQFAAKGDGPLKRVYLAFVWSVPERPRGIIDAPMGRHRFARDRQTVRESGRKAITHWELVEQYDDMEGKPIGSLLACTLETGRTHQIRVHLAHIGHPILGDETYGAGFKTKADRLTPQARTALWALGRQALHAKYLAFVHPSTGDIMKFHSNLPPDLAQLRDTLRGSSKS